RDRIGFRDSPSLIVQHKVWSDDAREYVTEFLSARILDQSRRFPDVEVARDPLRLVPSNTLLVELIAGALEDEKLVAQPLEIGPKSCLDREWFRRNQPF